MIMVEYDRHRSSHYQSQPRDPHFPHLDHHSAPSTPSPPYQYAHLPSFAQQQQSASVRSTPTSYPSPASYPSPSMSAYSYPPSQGHNSPHYQPMNLASYSLPPIRMTPPSTSLPPPVIPPPVGSPLPPPHMYYGHSLSAPQLSHITSSPQPLRYALPQERIMSGGRHKKEIKRRTKTGCLTCRKRRIKCDEAHPTCKNCTKSKRECMGYDPIFKTQPGPTAIQPAPASAIAASLSSSTSMPYGTSNASAAVYTHTTAASSPASSCETYEYSAIDPLLEATPLPTHPSAMSLLPESSTPYRQDLKRSYDRTSPLSCVSDTPRSSATPLGRSMTPNPQVLRDSPAANPAKRIKIDDLLSGGSNGVPLTPPSGDQVAGYIEMYRKRFAPRLDALLETNWFQTRGAENIMRGGPFGEQFGALLMRLHSRAGAYYEESDSSLANFGGDGEVLMASVRLIYGTKSPMRDERPHPTEQDDYYAGPSDIAARKETLHRLAIVEALVTGRNLSMESSSPQLSPKSVPTHYDDQRLGRGSGFWRQLNRFVSLKEGIVTEQEFEATLGGLKRHINESMVRGVLYRISEGRHYYKRLTSLGPEADEERRRVRRCFEAARGVVLATAQTQGDSEVDAIMRLISSRALRCGPFVSDNFLLV